MKLYGFADFEELLAFHCSPVLMNLKASNMISLPNSDEVHKLLDFYNKEFAERRIVFKKLCCCHERCLILIYQEERLRNLLKDRGYRAYLTAAGYDSHNSLQEDLAELERRLQTEKCFPHEIGVFLEYPLEDILGFVLNNGCNCKYSGYWKVYGDVDVAKKFFDSYEKCRNMVTEKMNRGYSLLNAVSA